MEASEVSRHPKASVNSGSDHSRDATGRAGNRRNWDQGLVMSPAPSTHWQSIGGDQLIIPNLRLPGPSWETFTTRLCQV